MRLTQMENKGWMEIDTCPTEGTRFILVWHLFQGTMVATPATARSNRFNAFWAEVADAWIDPAELLPTTEDADAQNCVVAIDRREEISVKGWHQIRAGSDVTGWMHCPAPPERAKELRKSAD